MGIEVIDMTGQPRSDQEIKEALRVVREILIKQSRVLPLFTVHAGIIMDCLKECLGARRQPKLGEYERGLRKAQEIYRQIHTGGCNIPSMGDNCTCFLCSCDREIEK